MTNPKNVHVEVGPSERVSDQRRRNRVAEALWSLVNWRESLANAGYAEYFETFFDWFPYEGEPSDNSALSPEERASLRQMHELMIEAISDTPQSMTEERFIATGWPLRIGPVAERALQLMVLRGRFSEQHEEEEPSSDDWPWQQRLEA